MRFLAVVGMPPNHYACENAPYCCLSCAKYYKRAQITEFRFHDLRHTWASWHVTTGTSLQELMELGGWKSYEMVLRYAHPAPDHLSQAAARIERTLAILELNSTKTLR